MSAAVIERQTRSGLRFALPDLLDKLNAAWTAHRAAGGAGWPLADVYRIVGPLSLLELSERSGICERSISRWHRTGAVPDASADRLAIGLDLHPCLVWEDFS